jgi:hypothetical protein
MSNCTTALTERIVLPSHLLTVNFLSFERQGNERILFPYGWTVRKQ